MTKFGTLLLFLILCFLPQFVFGQSESGTRPKTGCYFEDMDEGNRLVFRIREKETSIIKMAPHYDNAFGPGLIVN